MPSTRRTRPTVEALEERTLLSNTLVIDFAPGRVPHEQHLASFAAAMQLKNANGRSPGFLDFDHDGRVNGNDVLQMAEAVVQRVDRYFAGHDLNIVWGDLGRSTGLGLSSLRASQASLTPGATYVIYVGDVAFGGDTGTFGEAYQAPVGYNLEYYAYAFAGSMSRWYLKNERHATPQQFANDLGTTVAHEFGHLLGLGHVLGNPPGDPNPMNYNADPNTAYFPDVTYPAIQLRDPNLNVSWGPQDPAAEIRGSLAGQPAYDPTGLYYSSVPGTPKRVAERNAFLEVTSALEIEASRRHHRPHPDAGTADPVRPEPPE